MILGWVQSWNIFEKVMKLWSPPEFFHKNMSQEQLVFMWSTLRDSNMGTMLKYFWKTHESVQSAWIFSEKHVSRTITSHVIHISWFWNGYKIEIFLKSLWNCDFRLKFSTKTCLTSNYLSSDPHFVILSWVQSWNIFDKLMKVCRRLNFFTKTCLTNNYFSQDPQFVILALAQSWNICEKLMKVCSPSEFFHKNMYREQLLFTWFTFRDSSMGTKLKCFWKTHETLKTAWFYSEKHVSQTITFHMSHISWF